MYECGFNIHYYYWVFDYAFIWLHCVRSWLLLLLLHFFPVRVYTLKMPLFYIIQIDTAQPNKIQTQRHQPPENVWSEIEMNAFESIKFTKASILFGLNMLRVRNELPPPTRASYLICLNLPSLSLSLENHQPHHWN